MYVHNNSLNLNLIITLPGNDSSVALISYMNKSFNLPFVEHCDEKGTNSQQPDGELVLENLAPIPQEETGWL